jgi:hypothetical protein
MNGKQPSDLNALATEALNLWQEHLATLAADPKAKADLAQLMEPSRRAFAEWMEKVHNAGHGTASFTAAETGTGRSAATDATDRATSLRPASDDGSLRIAQLALHVAELEKRVAKLESRKSSTAAKAAGTSREPE